MTAYEALAKVIRTFNEDFISKLEDSMDSLCAVLDWSHNMVDQIRMFYCRGFLTKDQMDELYTQLLFVTKQFT